MKLLIKSIIIGLIFGVVLYQFTPPMATAMYELYHLVHIEFIYTLYTALKFLSAYFMLWDGRAVTAIIFGLICGLIYYWRKTRHQKMLQDRY